jgi:capsular polysaccharide biosynthesis protein
MELMLIFRILRRYWWLVLIPVAITAALAVPSLLRSSAPAGGGFTTMMRYSAAQQLDAIPGRDGDYQDVWLASELTVNALTGWVRSSSFAADVAQEAAAHGVTIDPAAVVIAADNAALVIAADNERSVGQIAISWPNDAELNTIAQAVMTVLQTRNQEAFPQLGGAPAQVTILDEPRILPAPPPLTDRFGPLIRVALGLLAGIALAFLAHYLDPMLRRREDVESMGLPVIASIPRK